MQSWIDIFCQWTCNDHKMACPFWMIFSSCGPRFNASGTSAPSAKLQPQVCKFGAIFKCQTSATSGFFKSQTVSASENVSKAVRRWLRRHFQSTPSGVSQFRPPSTLQPDGEHPTITTPNLEEIIGNHMKSREESPHAHRKRCRFAVMGQHGSTIKARIPNKQPSASIWDVSTSPSS